MDRANLYLSWGFIPIPIRPRSKAPAMSRWQMTGRRDALQNIYSAMRRFGLIDPPTYTPPLNLGIVCGEASGVIVLDIDKRGGGVERWESAISIFGKPDTLTVRTGSGGLHVYFRLPSDGVASKLPTCRDCFYPGWDLRSNGGQVLGPYSIHPETGREYMPEYGYSIDGSYHVIPHFSLPPVWLLDPYTAFLQLPPTAQGEA